MNHSFWWIGRSPHQRLRHFPCIFDVSLNVEKCREMSRNVEKCREMSSFENFKKFSETCEKMSSFENFWVSENFDFMHLTARKMIFNANYEEKLTESFQNKRNWVQLGSIGRLRHFPSVCDVSRNVEKCREMSRNVEKCRVLSKSLLGGDLP